MMRRRDFLAWMGLGTAGLAAGPLGCATPGPAHTASRQGTPNIVFILIDDLGWADVGCYGSTLYETPNIDRLAAEGLRFTDAYAACPVCSPTRASIMTGKYPARLKLTDWLRPVGWPKGDRQREGSPILFAEYAGQLELEEVTIAEALKSAGYATCHVGKWHLGGKPFWPERQGFDVNIGGTGWGHPRSYFWPRWKNSPPIEGNFGGEYLTDRLSEEACGFIEANTDRPFFLYLSHYSVHTPIQGKEDKVAKYQAKLEAHPPADGAQNNPDYAAMVESVDDSVGRVLDTLRRCKLDDNTIVVFFSDNGGLSVGEGPKTPATTNAPLRAGKGYLYEGGIRESCIVRWPGVTGRGGVCSTPISSIDFFPTLCEMAGLGPETVQTQGPIDGVSIVLLLNDPSATLDRDALYWHYPHFSNQGGSPGAAVRAGDWKLIERYEFGTLELYNLEDDLSETANLADRMPETARRLHRMLVDWREEVDANMPRPNPEYKGTVHQRELAE